MKQPRLPPGLTWFLTRSEIEDPITRPEVNLFWLGRNPPHEAPLVAEWNPQTPMTGPINVWVGAINGDRTADLGGIRSAVATRLSRWISDALAASPVWKSQLHRAIWSFDGARTELRMDDDLDPGMHQD